ncbi:hypothetical protein [Thalassospira xiamenensis]|uniref:HTH HARE-type domain-containing protein n=1 Tax=Thalassospira xiamenensis TaxID=220697 RepID=A0A285TYR5_9PROT|nr:hypothetical protein [Thalassospira xiamenensis]SOC31086.1 hypothetical protein SAMN05428964_1136 [Thalassospira xiamenensis]
MTKKQLNILEIYLQLAQKRDQTKRDLEALEAALSKFDLIAVETQNLLEAQISSSATPDDAEQIFSGLTQAEMAYKALLIIGRPLSAPEILDVWSKHDCAPDSVNPLTQVQTALRQRAKKHDDVMKVSDDKWGLRAWYPGEEKKEPQKAVKTQQQVHVSRTVEGIKQAKQKGRHHGAPPRLRPEHWELATQLIKEGASLREIHRQIVQMTPAGEKPASYQSVHHYKDRFLNADPYPENWKVFFESPQQSDADSEPRIRVIK